jgi:hypothetical protein
MSFADTSISEKPGAIVPHAGICAGPVGQLAVLPRCSTAPYTYSEGTCSIRQDQGRAVIWVGDNVER